MLDEPANTCPHAVVCQALVFVLLIFDRVCLHHERVLVVGVEEPRLIHTLGVFHRLLLLENYSLSIGATFSRLYIRHILVLREWFHPGVLPLAVSDCKVSQRRLLVLLSGHERSGV